MLRAAANVYGNAPLPPTAADWGYKMSDLMIWRSSSLMAGVGAAMGASYSAFRDAKGGLNEGHVDMSTAAQGGALAGLGVGLLVGAPGAFKFARDAIKSTRGANAGLGANNSIAQGPSLTAQILAAPGKVTWHSPPPQP